MQEQKEKSRAASPVTYATKDDAPMLMMHGDRDQLVPHAQSIELRPDGSHFGPVGAQYVGAHVSQAILECWRNALACRP